MINSSGVPVTRQKLAYMAINLDSSTFTAGERACSPAACSGASACDMGCLLLVVQECGRYSAVRLPREPGGRVQGNPMSELRAVKCYHSASSILCVRGVTRKVP